MPVNEFDVLYALALHSGEIVSRDNLINHFRGFDYDGFDRSMDIRISRLRKRIKDMNIPIIIKTVRGKGYLFTLDDNTHT